MQNRIGFLGTGRMATALASGIVGAGESVNMVAFDPDQTARENFLSKVDSLMPSTPAPSVEFKESAFQVFDSSEVVFLAVKPQYFSQAVAETKRNWENSPLLVSVMAGVSIDRIQRATGCDAVVRIMTNTPCLIGQAASAMACSDSVTEAQQHRVENYLRSVGIVERIEESLMDAVTGLSGSGPAYVFAFIESLVQGGVSVGLPQQTAQRLAVQTVIGAAKMVQQTQQSPGTLRDQVTSPGGTTIAGLTELHNNRFHYALIAAVQTATAKAKQLGSNADS